MDSVISTKGMAADFYVSDSGDGIHTIIIDCYEEFALLLGEGHFRDHPEYVFRGHRDPSWLLLPSLYRHFQEVFGEVSTKVDNKLRSEAGLLTAANLKHFIYALRGTQWHTQGYEQIADWFKERGNPSIRDMYVGGTKDEALWASVIDAWGLGQHHGLLTPLLDWTESLMTALYFAFEQADLRAEGEESRLVYALNRKLVEQRCKERTGGHLLEFVNPYSRNNQRMIAQQGLFTYSLEFQSVEDWVVENFQNSDEPVLIRILIRNTSSDSAIRWLSRAGISDRTLFPDIAGTSKFTNRILRDHDLNYTANTF